jgi:hypothetical protein
MNILKKIVFACLLSLSLVAVAEEAATPAAEVAAPAAAANADVAAVIGHIEYALSKVDIKSSDFTAATRHLKDARTASEKIQGHDAEAKQGLEAINAGMIQVKYGDNAKATELLQKALAIYKGIK